MKFTGWLPLARLPFLLAVLFHSAGSASAQWSSPYTVGARSEMAATVVGDKAFFAGGTPSHFFCPNYSLTVDIYDDATGAWSTHTLFTDLTNMAATSVGSKAIFAGGTESDCPHGVYHQAQVTLYDAASDTWSNAQLSVPRTSPAATSVGTKALIAGGRSGAGEQAAVDIYDDATGLWSTATLSIGRVGMAAATVGNVAFFAGGWIGYEARSEIDLYDDLTGTWSTASLPSAAGATTAAVVGTRVLFCNGTVVDTYDTQTASWTTTALAYARIRPAAVAVGDLVLIAGGVTDAGQGVYRTNETVDVYDAAIDAWRVERLPAPHGAGLAAVALGGKALFAGGGVYEWSGHTSFGRVDFYGPIVGSSYCGPAPLNSTGRSGSLTAAGDEAAAANDLTLWARDLPAGQTGILLASRTQGFVAHPGGSAGNLCLAGSIGRFAIQNSGAAGVIETTVDLTMMPPPLQSAVGAGETWYFQCWHRDVGGASNFTDAERIVFQ